MIAWYRIPVSAAKSLIGDHKATRTEATVDLLGRWHLGERPGVRELMRLWCWSGDRVTRLVGELQEWAPENGAAHPNKIGQRPDSDRTATGQAGNGETPTILEPSDSDRTATGQRPDAPRARVPLLEREEEIRDQDPPKAPQGGPECELERDPTNTGPNGPRLFSASETPTETPIVDSGSPGARGSRAKATPRKPDPEVIELYQVLRGAQPRRSATPTTAAAKAMRQILDVAGSLERAGIYLAWVHQSGDTYARQIRGDAPWPGGETVPRWSPEELARHLDARLDKADAWDARGRTDVQTERRTTAAEWINLQ